MELKNITDIAYPFFCGGWKGFCYFARIADKSVSSFYGWWLHGIKRISLSFHYSILYTAPMDECFCRMFYPSVSPLG
jgi:hypothetical protein